LLVLPTVCYGYTGHVMDFPGTINNHFEHFIDHVLDITKSLAYHGFKKIVLLNGHGSNMPNLDLVARRTNLETDAECVMAAWWNLLTVDKAFLPRWRQSKFPGGCSTRANLKPRSIFISMATTYGKIKSRAGWSASTKRTTRSIGLICLPPGPRRSFPGRAVTRKPGCSVMPNWPALRRDAKHTKKP